MCFALCSLITFSSLVPIVFPLGCQQTTFVTTGISGPSSPPDQFFHLPLFVAFPIPVGGEVAPSRTLCASLTHFTSSALGTLFHSSEQNLIFRCSDLFISLLHHLPSLLSTYFPFYSCWFFNFISMPLPSEWLIPAVHPLCSSSVLSLCCLHWTVQCLQKSKGQASSYLLENSSPDQDFRWWYLAVIFDFSVSFIEMEFCSYLLKK